MSYKLMQHDKNSRLYYADTDGVNQLLENEDALTIGDRVYQVEEDAMYYAGSDGQLYLGKDESNPLGEIEERVSALEDALDEKQDTLTAGENITIENNVISATGGGLDTITPVPADEWEEYIDESTSDSYLKLDVNFGEYDEANNGKLFYIDYSLLATLPDLPTGKDPEEYQSSDLTTIYTGEGDPINSASSDYFTSKIPVRLEDDTDFNGIVSGYFDGSSFTPVYSGYVSTEIVENEDTGVEELIGYIYLKYTNT